MVAFSRTEVDDCCFRTAPSSSSFQGPESKKDIIKWTSVRLRSIGRRWEDGVADGGALCIYMKKYLCDSWQFHAQMNEQRGQKIICPYCKYLLQKGTLNQVQSIECACGLKMHNTVCPRSRDPFHVVTNYIKWVTTSWTYSILYFFLWNISTELNEKQSNHQIFKNEVNCHNIYCGLRVYV